MFAKRLHGGAPAAPLYDWRPRSTYIRRPPYWDTEGLGALAASPRTLKGMRPLAILPDNITTDHLSPSNAILPTSAAGEYLTAMGVPEEDYQLLRHPSRRSPDGHARHLRQPPTGQ